ncbi:hypothetical protein HYQ46_001162 [Verticillium longisporum]|nr:hypothetical protein HYQ46_001162 [Verticillium longisporum]
MKTTSCQSWEPCYFSLFELLLSDRTTGDCAERLLGRVKLVDVRGRRLFEPEPVANQDSRVLVCQGLNGTHQRLHLSAVEAAAAIAGPHCIHLAPFLWPSL